MATVYRCSRCRQDFYGRGFDRHLDSLACDIAQRQWQAGHDAALAEAPSAEVVGIEFSGQRTSDGDDMYLVTLAMPRSVAELTVELRSRVALEPITGP